MLEASLVHMPAHKIPDIRELPRQADTDAEVIAMWLRKKSGGTQENYRRDLSRFWRVVGEKAIAQITLRDLHDFDAQLEDEQLKPSTRARALATIRSLLAFAARIGYTRFDTGGAFEAEKVERNIAGKLLSEAQVHRVLALEPNARNRVMLRLLYTTGIRASEAAGLKWKDLVDREHGGQITVFGKGSKYRSIPVPMETWKLVVSLRGDAAEDDPVLGVGRKQLWSIVKAAGIRAGVAELHPHLLRHAHASHAMDRNCSIALIQTTLGHSSVSTTSLYCHARPGDGSSLHLGM